jgi:hypothetical protein
MQKKKPSFQAIPNYSVSGLKNWNESKEVPVEQGWNDGNLRGFSNRGVALLRLITPASIALRSRDQCIGNDRGYFRLRLQPPTAALVTRLSGDSRHIAMCAASRIPPHEEDGASQ